MGKRQFTYAEDTTVPPERVIGALTDFSERRPEIWPALSAGKYKLLEQGDRTALVREGTATGWAEERYDWSEPGVVRITCQGGNFLNPGTEWIYRVSPLDAGGSHVDVHITRDYKGVHGLFWETIIRSMGGGKLLGRYLRQTLDILEKEEATATRSD
jgi:hypothetical protein